jgi:hypothetical protein
MASNQKINYLDFEKKGWCNNSGYGNIVITQLPHKNQKTLNSLVAPWDRIEPMQNPYSVGVNPHAWSPPLSAQNNAMMKKSCCGCMGDCYCK